MSFRLMSAANERPYYRKTPFLVSGTAIEFYFFYSAFVPDTICKTGFSSKIKLRNV